MWLQTHTIDFSGVAQPASSSEKAGTDSNQSSYKATGDLSERFWWGDHRRINDFAGYCCDLHQIMAGYAVTDKSNALSHRKPELASRDASSDGDLSKLDWNEFAVSYLRDGPKLTIQQKRDVEAVAKSQVLNDLFNRRNATPKSSGFALDDKALMVSLVRARDKADKARTRLKEQGIDTDERLRRTK